MHRIEGYFKSIGDDDALKANKGQKSAESGPAKEQKQPEQKQDEAAAASTAETKRAEPAYPSAESITTTTVTPSQPLLAASRPVTVYSPPVGNTPSAAQTRHNEHDYVPTTEQAHAHQKRLNQFSRPNRLPTDAEIAAKSAAEQERIANIQSVDVKVRFPDQSQVVATFGKGDTGKSLYDFVRSCLTEPLAREKFSIAYSPPSDTTTRPGGLGGRKLQSVIPDSERCLLIKDLGMAGRVLVNFSWDAGASPAKTGLLKPELQSRAQEHKIEEPPDLPDDTGMALGGSGEKSGESRPLRKGGVPKWLKLPGKK